MTSRREPPLTILTVCSYNRARSVMTELLLRRALTDADVRADVRGVGFSAGGRPPLPETIQALRALDLDATSTISERVDRALLHSAHLVLAAERVHVVRLVEDDRSMLRKVFTLPEFAELAAAAGPRSGRRFDEWLAVVGEGRTHASFLASKVPEIADPVGKPPGAFRSTALAIEEWCETVAALL
ncbi:MAG: hypothetical protein Q8M22_14785 [Actinomycetota bacterium]|nr:hypothetical protein [Actinomycetota bacterium]